MTVVSALSPISLQTFFNIAGDIVRPARLYFFRPQTEDPITVYSDTLLSVPYPHPLLCSGRVPPVYVGTEPYRIRVFDSWGALIEDIDYLPGAVAPAEDGGGPPPVPGVDLQTGDLLVGFTSGGTRGGFVRANGGYIGNVGFAGSGYPIERLNLDTHALFIHLWGQDTGNVLPIVPGGRGSSAENDWLASKAIALPDCRGRALAGLDGMGGSLTNLFTGVTFSKGTAQVAGSLAGVARLTQTLAQMPVHKHTLADPGHVHIYDIPQISQGIGAGGGYDFTFGEAETDLVTTGITMGDAGSGEAMTTLSPFTLLAIYIKL